MRISKATSTGVNHMLKRHSMEKTIYRYAYNIFNNDEWAGVILFRDTEAGRFDKWKGQVLEMISVPESLPDEAYRLALKSLSEESPLTDLVISGRQFPLFIYMGEHGGGKNGAFIIGAERISPKMVKARGWRPSILWLRENVDENTTQFDRHPTSLYYYPLDDVMADRMLVMN